jgi:hypothetical protein
MPTAVLVFTTHGDIQVKSPTNPELTEEVDKFRVPEGMEIVTLNAISPGAVNLLPPVNVAPFVKIVRDSTREFNDRTTKKQMKDMVKSIREQIIERDDQPGVAAKAVREKNESFTDDDEIMAYHHNSHEFLYKIRTWTKGLVPNKEYLREDKLLYKKNYEGEYVKLQSSNWKLNLLVDGVSTDEDLMDTLNPIASITRTAHLREGFTITRLRNIISELYARGIHKVIIIDLTCSVIRKKQQGVTDRTARNIKLQTIREESPETPSAGGRKTIKVKRYLNKTIRNKYKK